MNAFTDKLKQNQDKSESDKPEVQPETIDDSKVVERVEYTSRPVASLRLGKWQFENARLSLDPEKAAEFDAFFADYKKNNPSSRASQVIHKIDRDAADRIAKQFLAARQGATTIGVDTSTSGTPSPSPQQHAE